MSKTLNLKALRTKASTLSPLMHRKPRFPSSTLLSFFVLASLLRLTNLIVGQRLPLVLRAATQEPTNKLGSGSC